MWTLSWNGSRLGLETISMGLTDVRATVANPRRPKQGARVRLLVDSCAVYSVVPARILRQLGIKPSKTKSFILADGTEVKRPVGHALFRFNGDEAPSPVIFGEAGDSLLLGSMSLEALGLMLYPFKRELRPLPMMLAPHLPVP
jgi:clan AA aspartic protease